MAGINENSPLLRPNRTNNGNFHPYRKQRSGEPSHTFTSVNTSDNDINNESITTTVVSSRTLSRSDSDIEQSRNHVKIEKHHLLKASFESLDYEVSDNLLYQNEEREKSSKQRPVAAGSGIPQIKCYLNGVIVPHVVRIKTLITKVIGVGCAVGGGLAVGKEGPMIHSGAVIAAGVSQGRSTTLGIDFKIFHDFRSDTEKRDFVSAGAAAGVAAAFGAPVGGVLFSLEEGASFWNQSLVWRIFFASMVSTMTLNIVQSFAKGHPWELAYPGLINFGTFGAVNYRIYELLIVVCMGAIGGLLGALFNHINYKLTIFRMKYVQRGWQKVLEVLMVAAYTPCFAFLLIFFSNDCRDLTDNKDNKGDTDSVLVQFFCGDGNYSSSAKLFFDTPEATVRHLLHNEPGTYQIVTLSIFATGYFFLACWTYGLSVPSGLFIPGLLVGSAWGRIVGIFVSWASGKASWVSLSFYSLVGASSMLGGIVRMTISLTVIIMETTSNVPLGLPVMISLIVAKWVGDQFTEGIYDLHIHLQGVPILGWEPLPLSTNLSAKAVMSHPVTVFRMKEPVERIIRVLKEELHNGFPVVEDYDPQNPVIVDGCETFGSFRGLILRSQLVMMLQKKLFMENPEINNVINNLKMAEFNECYPRYTPIQKISISPVEKLFTMDLAPFINQSHFVVLESASYSSIFRKFRSLGLRHMVVINFRNQVIGIVTRKDLARYMTECKNGEVSIQEKTIVM
ncbi:hypothetical protein BsWGS_20936 [Bradybaena similaris]